FRALLRLHTGDQSGYRKLCELMASRFGDPNDPRAWEREEVARVCLHVEPSAVPPERLVALTERALESGKTSVRLARLGTALYRAGQYDFALSRLNQANDVLPQAVSVWTNSVSAMCHFRLGQLEHARNALHIAAKELGRRFSSRGDNSANTASTAWWLEL